MSCTGLNAVNPFCRVGDIAATAANDAFTTMAGWMGKAATDSTTWLWAQISSATQINLGSPQLTSDLAVTSAIALTLTLGLFVIQVITSVLRREPAGLARAVKGVPIALMMSVFAFSVTTIALGATDQLSAGVVQYAMGTDIAGLGRRLAFGSLASVANPGWVLIFSLLILAAVFVLWGAMMIRKMLVIIAAVLTPLAFSGATADITGGWVRKWVEFMAAMIASKLLLVIIFMVGVSVMEGAGMTAHPTPSQQLTQVATGSLILLLAGFAPWIAIKMFHFTGDALHSAHVVVASAPAGGRTVIAAPAKVAAMAGTVASAGRLGSGRGSPQLASTPPKPPPPPVEPPKTPPAPAPHE